MQHPFLTGRSLLVTHLIGWVLVASIFFSLIYGMRGSWEAFTRTTVNLAFMVLLFYGNARLLVNRLMEKGKYGQLVFGALLFCFVAAGARAWVEIHFFGRTLFDTTGETPQFWRLWGGYSISFFLLLLFSTLYQLTENRQYLEVQHSDLKARHAEAQLNYLKARINPHFLFNTLNNIYAAATLQHPRTPDMVLRISDLLRYVTYDAAADRVPLEKEVEQIHAYTDLYSLSAETAPAIEFKQTGDMQHWQIEPVLLLPLVENAIKHGDLNQSETAFLRIQLDVTPDRLFFCVQNSYNPENQQKDALGGVGLENVQQRLALNQQMKGQLITTANDGIYEARIELLRKPSSAALMLY
jgi:two-component system LytT family sensor kinase